MPEINIKTEENKLDLKKLRKKPFLSQNAFFKQWGLPVFAGLIAVVLVMGLIFFFVGSSTKSTNTLGENTVKTTPRPPQITATLTPDIKEVFYRGYNLGGGDIIINNNRWQAANRNSQDLEFNGDITRSNIPNPGNLSETEYLMLSDSIIHKGKTSLRIRIKNIDAGNYHLYFYTYEPERPVNLEIFLNRRSITPGMNTGNKNQWKKFGPYQVDPIADQIEINSSEAGVHLAGIEIYKIVKTD